jgi:hypothetical protein
VLADASTFRLTVYENKSAMIKSYRKVIHVRSPKLPPASNQSPRQQEFDSPLDMVSGFGPRLHWNHYVKPLYEIFVRPDGTSTKPFRFMTKPDRNDWVRWNQRLDEENVGGRNFNVR